MECAFYNQPTLYKRDMFAMKISYPGSIEMHASIHCMFLQDSKMFPVEMLKLSV